MKIKLLPGAMLTIAMSLSACVPSPKPESSATVQQAAPAAPSVDLSALPLDPSKPFVNLVSVKIKPELLPKFLETLKPYAELTRREPGVCRYVVHQSPHDPTVIELYEFYRDSAARTEHNNSAHRNEFFGKVRENGFFSAPAVSKVVHVIDPDGAKCE